MNPEEHKKYLKKFKAFSTEITASRQTALKFLIDAGINTPTGKLTKAYKAK